MCVITEHYKVDNVSREEAAKSVGSGVPIAKFYWNRSHHDGAEWHLILSNGVIEIYNVNTNRLVTKLIARPHQLLRYVEMGMVNELNEKTKRMRHWIMPQSVLNLAKKHQQMGLNYS